MPDSKKPRPKLRMMGPNRLIHMAKVAEDALDEEGSEEAFVSIRIKDARDLVHSYYRAAEVLAQLADPTGMAMEPEFYRIVAQTLAVGALVNDESDDEEKEVAESARRCMVTAAIAALSGADIKVVRGSSPEDLKAKMAALADEAIARGDKVGAIDPTTGDATILSEGKKKRGHDPTPAEAREAFLRLSSRLSGAKGVQ